MANTSPYHLGDGARMAVIGGGPAGAFFAHFLLGMAARAGRRIDVDIYEPRDFKQTGAHGCNGCAGIVSERLVQTMAADGIDLPATVVQRNIDSYVVHMDAGSAQITPPRPGTRIAAVHRGAGPRDLGHVGWTGLRMLHPAFVWSLIKGGWSAWWLHPGRSRDPSSSYTASWLGQAHSGRPSGRAAKTGQSGN